MTNSERIGKVLEALERGAISEDKAVKLVTALNPAVSSYYTESQNERETKQQKDALATISKL